MQIPVSVGILTFNSGGVLRRALKSVENFSEIIVCDGGSKDNTLSIAREFGATIINQDPRYKNPNGSIANFSGVRNQMLDSSKHNWFLFIDSDEYLSKESEEEIQLITSKEINDKSILAYWIPRKRVYRKQIVMCASTYPSYQMRFFHKRGVTKFIKEVHERIELKNKTKTGYLKECEYVPFEFTKDAWKKKLIYYLDIETARHQNQPFSDWLRYIVFNSIKSSTLYTFRYLRNVLFCRGVRMPFWYEVMQHWYYAQLIMRTGKKYFL